MEYMLDILRLHDKYQFNEDNIKSGNYIDDGSLLVYYKIMQGWFTGKDMMTMSFIFGNPVEWNNKDLTACLLKISKEYNLKIENIDIIWGAIEEEFEKNLIDEENKKVLPEYEDEFLLYFKKQDEYNKKVKARKIDKNDIHTWFEQVQKYNPKHYEGAYKWALDQLENNPNTDFSKLFKRLKTENANPDDIEKILIYSSRLLPYEVNMKDEKEVEALYSKEIMGYILSYLSFSVVVNEKDKEKMKEDIGSYLDLFIEDKLQKGREKIKIQGTTIKYPDNILNFKSHQNVFSNYIKEMIEKYGNEFTITNKFEDEISYDNSELSSEDIKERYRKRDFLFIHCVLAFNRLGLINSSRISNNWDALDIKPLHHTSYVKVLPKFFAETSQDKLYFDTDKSRLYVQGKEIKLLKFKDEYHTLRIMFEDTKDLPQEWFFSEIAERIDESNLNDKKYYNAIYQIRLKLEKQGINDFFITTKQSVKINKKYLS